MTTFTLTIDMDNDAFSDDPGEELARILRDVVALDVTLCHKASCHPLKVRDVNVLDVNGNAVGRWQIVR